MIDFALPPTPIECMSYRVCQHLVYSEQYACHERTHRSAESGRFNKPPLLLILRPPHLRKMRAECLLDHVVRVLGKPVHRQYSSGVHDGNSSRTYLAFKPFNSSSLPSWLPTTASLNSSRSSLLSVLGAGFLPRFTLPCVAVTLLIGPF